MSELAQLICFNPLGASLTEAETEFITRNRITSFMLFARNLPDLASARAMLARLHTLAEQPLICIDQEGGRVTRLPEPATHLPSAMAVGATRSPELAYRAGQATARELRAMRVKAVLAPVLDVNVNPANPVIGTRSFGESADLAGAMGLAWLRGAQDGGIAACAKHFPGHGDTQVDSHHELPVLDLDLDQIKARELLPFAAAIACGIEMIMTSHILYRKLDPNYPVTLSRAITHGLLREAMKFDGVIVSDDVGMRAMAGRLDAPDSGARFMAAGNDMLMICSHLTDTERARALAQSIINGVDQGKLDPAVLKASAKRVHAMLDSTAQNEVSELSAEVFARHRGAGTQFEAATVEVV